MTEFESTMSGAVQNKLLAKLEKIMALHDAATTEGELEAAALRMAEILEKLGLSEAQARAEFEKSSGKAQAMKIVAEQAAWLEDKRTTWEMRLASAIAEACMCEVIYFPGHMTFVGTEVDTTASVYMWSQFAWRIAELSQTRVTGYAQDYKRQTGKSAYKSLGQAHLKQWRRNWLSGCVDGIYTKIVQRKQLVGPEVKALVLSKDNAIEEAKHRMFKNLRSIKIRRVQGLADAYGQGFEEGAEMQLNPGLNAPARPKGLLIDID